MLEGKEFNIIAGLDVIEQIRKERKTKHYDLITHQVKIADRGILGVELVESVYGWTVRYDSGLQNWGILSRAAGRSDPSYKGAVRFAKEWQSMDPNKRYVWTRAR